jgi:cold shock CspA family protein
MNVLGVVTKFDEARGDGQVTADSGELFYFHCVSISDGTRYLDVGTRVTARRQVGHKGEDQVVDVRALE